MILHGADQIAQLAEKVFKLPEEEKLKHAYQAGDLFGYALPLSWKAYKLASERLSNQVSSACQVQTRRPHQSRRSLHPRHRRILQHLQRLPL
jgi:isopenicillin N synthase-like dioxygenase